MRFARFTDFSCAVDEGFEDPVLDLVAKCQFGMPLYAEGPSVFGLDGLDNIGGAFCGDPYTSAGCADGLTMQADNFA